MSVNLAGPGRPKPFPKPPPGARRSQCGPAKREYRQFISRSSVGRPFELPGEGRAKAWLSVGHHHREEKEDEASQTGLIGSDLCDDGLFGDGDGKRRAGGEDIL